MSKIQPNPVNVVWFKRDLRLSDHAPLQAAISSGLPILPVFFYEPEGITEGDISLRHWKFCRESISEMSDKLAVFGGRVYEFHGDPREIFRRLAGAFPIAGVYSHRETGVEWTFRRDRELAAFFRNNSIDWHEFDFSGIRRGLRDRREWSAAWQREMRSPPVRPELRDLKCAEPPAELLHEFAVPEFDARGDFQKGGTSRANEIFAEFAERRAAGYLKNIGRPHESAVTCSRLSPYLAWGNVSVRQIYRLSGKIGGGRDVTAFRSRLAWRDHFIQRFEMDMSIEFRPLNRFAAELDRPENPELVRAWCEGRTGFPLVDAAMRAVDQTGWLNFRLRALIVSFLTHLMWSDWRSAARFLASRFLDYEPGIHYSQFMMQSGESGFHTIRVYNPAKQAADNDPDGQFIRRWLPEIAHLPAPLIFRPDGEADDYPRPVIEYEKSYRRAVKTLWEWRKREDVRRESERLLGIHRDPEADKFRT